MKQTLQNNKPLWFGSIAFGLLFSTLTVTAQEQKADSLETAIKTRHGNIIRSKSILPETDFNKGFITNPIQLFNGNIAGLQQTNIEGQPGSNAAIKLHNYTSVFGNNIPLVILDGLPLSFTNNHEFHGFLTYINPLDIASVSFISTNAAIAVYGSIAANGVLILTSKQPQRTTKVTYSGAVALSNLRKKADVLSADVFRQLIKEKNPDNAELLGKSNTDWQDIIYRKAISHDHHISLSGEIVNALPYRLALGHHNQQGIMKASWNKRNTIALNLNPELIKDQLGLQVNVLGAQQDARIANRVINTLALMFDPTQQVYQQNKYGNYFLYLDSEGNVNPVAPINPLLYLEQQHIYNNTNTLNVNSSLNYKLHAVPGLNFKLLYGYQNATNKYESSFDYPAYTYSNAFTKEYKFKNRDAEVMLRYNLPVFIDELAVNLMAGISSNVRALETSQRSVGSGSFMNLESGNLAYFSNLHLDYKQTYSITTAFSKHNNSHRPSSDQLFSYAVGGTLNLLQLDFLKSQTLLTNLSLHANYLNFDKYEFGDLGTGVLTSPQLKPEKVVKLAFGTSFGLFDNKLTGNLDYTRSRTKDMWLVENVYPQNGYSRFMSNLSGLSSNAVELNLNYHVLNNSNFTWNVKTNLNYSRNQIEKLQGNSIFYYKPQGLSFTNSMNYVLEVGKPANTFNLYEHEYDRNGRPIEGKYVTSDNAPSGNRFSKNTADPSFIFGVSTDLQYKKMSLGLLLRGNAGNYVYNFSAANQGYLSAANGINSLANLNNSYLKDDFTTRQATSHYYVENASFLRMEYLQLGYNAGAILKEKANLNVYASIQNAFVITKYSGQDPEVTNGVDQSQYPTPVIYSVGVKMDL